MTIVLRRDPLSCKIYYAACNALRILRFCTQGIELDFNNENAHRGDADAGGGLAPPVSYGLSVSGAAPFRSTAAVLVSGPGTNRIW